jgi:hypothetical protein
MHEHLILSWLLHLAERAGVQEVGDSLDLVDTRVHNEGKHVDTLYRERLAVRRFTVQTELHGPPSVLATQHHDGADVHVHEPRPFHQNPQCHK